MSNYPKPLLSNFLENNGTPAVLITNIIILTIIIINTIIILTMIILTKPVPTGWVSPNCQKASHLYSFIQLRHVQAASLARHHHQSPQWQLWKMNQFINLRSCQKNRPSKMSNSDANKFDKTCFAQMLLHPLVP